ncbi:hypothetical protein C8034_v011359 [Colletotrichum sidae]|uniref:Uncharacterized protein n=1 Tax=Colletotrichum sidae TaxID=1347389 RepID=A0A4R8TIS5_9PEZI|nr:hypothetical protein C8034_v011359 [Colletotrichum sidae]
MPLVDKYPQLQQAEHATPPDGHNPSVQPKGVAVIDRERALAETSAAVMNKVAILTSSTHEPGVNIRQRSELIALFGPTLEIAVRFQRLVAIASSLLFVYGRFLATSTLTSTLIATRLFLAHSAFASSKILSTLRSSICIAWKSKNIQRIRKKLFIEFVTTILGPGGNMLILVAFWPGWLFILGLLLAFRAVAG